MLQAVRWHRLHHEVEICSFLTVALDITCRACTHPSPSARQLLSFRVDKSDYG